MEVIFSNAIDYNIDIAGTSLTVEGPEVCTETISPVQPSKTQRKSKQRRKYEKSFQPLPSKVSLLNNTNKRAVFLLQVGVEIKKNAYLSLDFTTRFGKGVWNLASFHC